MSIEFSGNVIININLDSKEKPNILNDEELAAKIKKAVLEAIARDCMAAGVVKDK